MSESVEKIITHVSFEIDQIDQLLVVYADLWERVQQRTPDLVEVAATAAVLHSFYTGLENIFLSIAKELDHQVPSGLQWHRDLLVQMSQPTANRRNVISAEMILKLTDYMGFRHFFRHAYSFFLDWEKLRKLVIPLREVWADVKKELDEFLGSLTPPESNRSALTAN